MKIYLKMLKDVYDDDKLVWNKGKEYLVAYENSDTFFFGSPITYGIRKELIDINFQILCKP